MAGVFIPRLGDLYPSARIAAIGALHALSDPGDPEVMEAIAGRLSDDDGDVRKKAFDALGDRAQALCFVRSLLLAMRASSEIESRQMAACLLSRIDAATEEMVPDLIEALADESAVDPADAAEALGRIGPAANAAVPRLLAYLEAGASNWDAEAFEALLRIAIEDPQVVEGLVRNIEEEASSYTVCKRLEAVARLGEKAAPFVPLLREMLASPDPGRAACACEAAGHLGSHARELHEELRRLADEGPFRVGVAARNALHALGAEE
jgi:HEAT repeat protein